MISRIGGFLFGRQFNVFDGFLIMMVIQLTAMVSLWYLLVLIPGTIFSTLMEEYFARG